MAIASNCHQLLAQRHTLRSCDASAEGAATTRKRRGRRGVRGRTGEQDDERDTTSFGDRYALRERHAPDDTPPLDPGEESQHRNPSTEPPGTCAARRAGEVVSRAAPAQWRPVYGVRRLAPVLLAADNIGLERAQGGSRGGAARTPRRPRRGLGRGSGGQEGPQTAHASLQWSDLQAVRTPLCGARAGAFSGWICSIVRGSISLLRLVSYHA